MKSNYGLVHIYTGDGKGKTSAAVGLAARVLGAGDTVLFAQLFKHESSELASLRKLGAKIMQYSHQHPELKTDYSKKQLEQMASECETFVESAFELAREDKYDLLVLDEIGPALSCKFLSIDKLVSLIKSKPKSTELALTGRGIPAEIISLVDADYVTQATDMRMIKHPYVKNKTLARKGIEF
jgi:cob(I)alamin adenosyltransferase